MKRHPALFFKGLTMGLSLFCFFSAIAQPSPHHLPNKYEKDFVFINRAPTLMPKLYDEGKWTEMRNFLLNWENSAYPSEELIMVSEILVSMETGEFNDYPMPYRALSLFKLYASELKTAAGPDSASFRYHIPLNGLTPDIFPSSRYDASKHARALLLFLQGWATDIMSSPTTDREELAICRIIAGVTENPAADFKIHSLEYPSLTRVDLDRTNSIDEHLGRKMRGDRYGGAIGLTVGYWSPTGNLKRFGNCVSIGAILGVRRALSEIDLNVSIRFSGGSVRPYYFVKDDSMYSSTYFKGANAMLDYTRFLIHRKHFDAGVLAGLGLESILTGPGDKDPELDSFVYGGGVRMKYYPGPTAFCIGLAARYNKIGFSTHGGSDLSGNSWNLELSFSLF